MKTRKAETAQPTHTPTPWFNWGTDHQGRRPTICDKAPGTGYSISSEIASVNRDADAAFIVRSCNHFEQMLSAMKQVKASLDKKRYGDRKEGELEGYFALCEVINEAEK